MAVHVVYGCPCCLREMFRDDIEEGEWQRMSEYLVWLRLAKLESSGCGLGKDAKNRLKKISDLNPGYKLRSNESDEFSFYMSSSNDPDFKDDQCDIAPRKRKELVEWLKISSGSGSPDDNWTDVCRSRFFHSLLALSDLAKNGEWPLNRWHTALGVWSEKTMVMRYWQCVAPLVKEMPDDILQENARSVTLWLETVSNSVDKHDEFFLDLCKRILKLPIEIGSGVRRSKDDSEIYDHVTSALNHPIGQVTRALLNFWFKQGLSDNDFIPDVLKPIFTDICKPGVESFRHGRVFLAVQLITFFRVDNEWTTENLLPLFDWSNPDEAAAVWDGFLWSPRLYSPLLIELKPYFLDCANNYSKLGTSKEQFSRLLTYASLEKVDGFSEQDFRDAIRKLPQKGLEESAKALYQGVKSAGEKSEVYWKNRALPFIGKLWPKQGSIATSRIAGCFTELAIATKSHFPQAIEKVKPWLKPVDCPQYYLQLLTNQGLCKSYPEHALFLLDKIIEERPWVPQEELGQCLREIAQNEPKLEDHYRYKKLIVITK